MAKKEKKLPWYARDVAKFRRNTSHLSLTELGAYDRLLDHYYENRKPLPHLWVHLYRICGALEDFEQAAVQAVVQEFFTEKNGKWHHLTADEEIENSKKLSETRRKAQKIGQNKKGTNEVTNAGTKGHTSTSTYTYIKESPLTPQGEGVFKNGFSEKIFNIEHHLSDDQRTEAKRNAPNWDLSGWLIPEYNQLVNDGKFKRPDKPACAFIAWVKKRTGGKPPP